MQMSTRRRCDRRVRGRKGCDDRAHAAGRAVSERLHRGENGSRGPGCGTSISPLRNAIMKASTTAGSNSLPAPLARIFSHLIRRHRLAVRPVTRERVVDVGHRDDPSLQRNLRACRRVVARAVELVVMGEDDREDPA